MKRWIQHFYQLNRLNWLMVWLLLCCSIILLFPAGLMKGAVSQWAATHAAWLGVGMLIAISYFCSQGFLIAWEWACDEWQSRRQQDQLAQMISFLDFNEKAVLREFVLQRKSVINLPITEPAVKNLMDAGVLTYAYGKPAREKEDENQIRALERIVGEGPVPAFTTSMLTEAGRPAQARPPAASAAAATPSQSLPSAPLAMGGSGTRVISVMAQSYYRLRQRHGRRLPRASKRARDSSAPSWPKQSAPARASPPLRAAKASYFVPLLGTIALEPLALKLAGAADGSGLFTGALFRGLFEVTAQLHFAVHALALQLLLERAQGLVNIVVANENLHAASSLVSIMKFWRRRRADKGHALPIEGADVPDQTANVHLWNRAFPCRESRKWGQNSPCRGHDSGGSRHTASKMVSF